MRTVGKTFPKKAEKPKETKAEKPKDPNSK